MKNYFNQLTLSQKIDQLGKCRFMDPNEFNDGVSALKGKKILII
jgi:ketol-acid reductoisomerase